MPLSQSRATATRPVGRSCLRALIALLFTFALGAAPGAAHAAVSISALYSGPITAASDCAPDGSGAVPATQAGSHPDYCIAYSLNSPDPAGDDMQQEIVDTPLGFAGDLTGRPICTTAQFAADTSADVTCPTASQVGTATADLRLLVNGSPLSLYGINGRAFLITPSAGEVARIGIVLDPPANPKTKIQVHINLRPAPNVGLRSTIDDLPRKVCLSHPVANCDYQIATDGFTLRFWGSNVDHPSMPAPFALLGADCSQPQVTKLSGTTYEGGADAKTSSYQLTDCASAPFAPTLALSTAQTRPDLPTAATVTASFGAGSGGRVAASPKQVSVTLPAGLSLAAQIASGPSGLRTCSADAFGVTTVAASACPDGSAVGTVKITSPVLNDPLSGDVFVGPQAQAGALPAVYVEAALSAASNAPRVKLVGTLSTNDQNQLVATFADLPQVPVSSFVLSFRGGSNAAFVTPPTCGSSNATVVAQPQGGGAAVTQSVPYAITDDCDAVTGFAPAVGFTSATGQAGGSGDFVTTLARPDRSQRITRAQIDLPPGQVANLKGIPECASDVAARGGCDAASRVGSVSALAGVGEAPYRVNGDVYLTARADGSVAAISIHVPVKLGGVDLGSLDVPAQIQIRPEDLGLRILADVPQYFRGLPLDLRSLEVHLDRAGFPLNPTSCGALTSTSVLTGSGGGSANVSAGYQVQGCDKLAFAPTLDAAVSGDTKAKGHPNVAIKITNAAGAGALRSAAVTLPEGVAVDLKELPRACPQDTFKAGGCPDSAKIGTAGGALSITDEPLAGSVYLLKPAAGSVLPGLGLQFVGRFAGRIVGANAVDAKSGQLISKFDLIPDLPVTALQINITGGTGGPLIATDALCSQQVGVAAHFASWSGAAADRSVRTVCGAPLAAKLTALSGRIANLRKGKPTLSLKGTGEAGRTLSRVDLTLPAGWSLGSQRGKSSARYVKVSKLSVKGSAVVRRRSPRRVRITLPKAGSTKFSALSRTGTIGVKKTADRKTKKVLVLKAVLTYKDGTHYTVPMLLAPH